MAVLTYTSTARAVDVPSGGYADCCGLPPAVVRWPRHRLVRVSCSREGCPLHEVTGRSADGASGGVLGGDDDIRGKWSAAPRREAAALA